MRQIRACLPYLLTALVTFLAYWNAWPDALVFDDKMFAGQDRFNDLSLIPTYFNETVWSTTGYRDQLYRPVLLTSFALDFSLLGYNPAAWHMVNVVLHLIATLTVLILVRQMLRMSGLDGQSSTLLAMLAAMIFGVHPIHTEVVNSIFNRSSIFVALGIGSGLWWLLKYLESKPLIAWLGIWLVCWPTFFSRETGIVLPVLAVAVAWLFMSGNWQHKLRRCLPAISMVIPMLVYLAMRANASYQGQASAVEAAVHEEQIGTLAATSQFSFEPLLTLAGVWLEALRLSVWPNPLLMNHPEPGTAFQIAGAITLILLAAASVRLYRRGSVGLLSGLIIFYVALLPTSRLVGTDGFGAHLAERYLYEPTIGLAVIVAFVFAGLQPRIPKPYLVGFSCLILMALAPITWSRNAQWDSDIKLMEHDYSHGVRRPSQLQAYTKELVLKGDYRRAVEVCRDNETSHVATGLFHLNCGSAYLMIGDAEAAERVLLNAANDKAISSQAHSSLTYLYSKQGRTAEALEQMGLSAESERDPARKAWLTGSVILASYPNDRTRLLEARSLFEEALRIQPGYADAKKSLEMVDSLLSQ